jgi:hypothetical protein
MMSSLSAARRARPKRTDVWSVIASGARRSAWAPALAALLSISCQRNLAHDPPPSRGGAGAGGSAAGASGGKGGGATGSNGGNNGGNGGNGGSGGSTADAGAPQDASVDRSADTAGGCPLDCSHLPNVQANILVKCVLGKCLLPPNSCLPGFANCSGNLNTGCEADLSTSSNCGTCGSRCAAGQTCTHLLRGGFFCMNPCPAPYAACGDLCVAVQADIRNCGACGNDCYLPNAEVACMAGKCVSLGCIDPSWADCTSDPGCETPLGQPGNCGACGDPSCTLANTLFTCADGGKCDAAVCVPGFANCDATSADCETSFDSPPASGSCLPHYVGTVPIATESFDNAVTAIAPDGSFFLAGTFSGSVDFDPSSGRDIRTTSDKGGYITKFNSDGSYGWTAVLAGRGDIMLNGLAITPGGNVVAAGFFFDIVDFDPGPGTDFQINGNGSQPQAFVVELTATATLAWATLPGWNFAGGVAVDGTGAVYVTGGSIGNGGGGDVGSLAKLTAGGTVSWSHALDNGPCAAGLRAVAVAKDGTVWATGSAGAGDGCNLAPEPGKTIEDAVLILRLTSGGDTLSVRTFGDNPIAGSSGFGLAASSDGSMYLGGTASGNIVFDPGPPPVRRWLNNNGGGGFLLKLDATGAVLWSRSVNGPYLSSIAATPDGGVLAAGSSENYGMFVTRLGPTGSSIWSFEVGPGQASALSISSSGTGFMVGGTSAGGTVDFDPGAAIDPIFGEISFVSRFTF